MEGEERQRDAQRVEHSEQHSARAEQLQKEPHESENRQRSATASSNHVDEHDSENHAANNNDSTATKDASVAANNNDNDSTATKDASVAANNNNNDSTATKDASVAANNNDNDSTATKDASVAANNNNDDSTATKDASVAANNNDNDSTATKDASVAADSKSAESSVVDSGIEAQAAELSKQLEAELQELDLSPRPPPPLVAPSPSPHPVGSINVAARVGPASSASSVVVVSNDPFDSEDGSVDHSPCVSPVPQQQLPQHQDSNKPRSSKQARFEMNDVLHGAYEGANRLFEHFVVVGVPVHKYSGSVSEYEPEVLFCYPPLPASQNAVPLASVMQFCTGGEKITTKNVRRSYSDSELNLLVHGSDHAFSKRHVFCFNVGAGTYYWGSCLIKEELLSVIPSFMDAESPSLPAHVSSERIYCLISRYPLFNVHFDILLSVLARERAHRLALTNSADAQAGDNIQQNEHDNDNNNNHRANGDALPPLQELNNVLAVSVVPAMQKFESVFDLFVREIKLTIPFQLGPQIDGFFSDCIVEQTFAAMLQKLTVPNVLRIFNAVLLCKQIVFRSRVAGLVSAACLATAMMLRPHLRWEGLLIPILPPHMHTALMAPVPFIIGIVGPLEVKKVEHLDGIFVDLDLDRVQFFAAVPPLPAVNQLYNNVLPVTSVHFVRNSAKNPTRAPFDPSPQQRAASLEAISCFKAYNSWLLGKLLEYVRLHPQNNTLKTLRPEFLLTVTPANRAFVQAWLQTQHVCVYLECLFARRSAGLPFSPKKDFE